MKFCTLIDDDCVISCAKNLVKSAKKEIRATMDVDEELRFPLPQSYHQLLIQKAREGVRIVRYGYGSKVASEEIKRLHANITYIYNGQIKNYQRMLVVDGKALFKLGNQVYYTEFKPLAQSLVKYAEIKYNKEEL